MADCSIILYLECLKGLIYHFKKLGQRDLNKKIYIKIITILFDVRCYTFVSRVHSCYHCLIWKIISAMWLYLKVNGYIWFFIKS